VKRKKKGMLGWSFDVNRGALRSDMEVLLKR
jgi:hypothetical protein